MNIAVLLKENMDKLPPSLGQALSYIPYKYRPGLGKIYAQRKAEIKKLEIATNEAKKRFIFQRVKNIVEFAVKEVPFYQEYYKKKGFEAGSLQSFEDLSRRNRNIHVCDTIRLQCVDNCVSDCWRRTYSW